jgi:hypothetical protein
MHRQAKGGGSVDDRFYDPDRPRWDESDGDDPPAAIFSAATKARRSLSPKGSGLTGGGGAAGRAAKQ